MHVKIRWKGNQVIPVHYIDGIMPEGRIDIVVQSGILGLTQWFPKCGARPPGGAQEVCRAKN
jgi:hypothetical protein